MGADQRKQPRTRGYAKAIHAASGIPGYVRDLSVTGCYVSFLKPIDVHIGDEIEIQIVSGGGVDVPPFSLRLVVRWKKEDGIYFSIGGELPGDTADPHFTRLVEYYQSPL